MDANVAVAGGLKPVVPHQVQSPVAAPFIQRLAYLGSEFLVRLGACSAEYIFLFGAMQAFEQDPSRISLLPLCASGIVSIVLLIFARVAIRIDRHPLVLASLAIIYGYPAVIDVTPGVHLLPEYAATGIQMVALSWLLFAKFSIGRSFGLLPANRGIVIAGAFKWVRHPIYAGYILFHIGFLAASFSWHNLLLFAAVHSVQIFRMMREEKLLSEFESYRDYKLQVRYRLLPGVF